MKSIVKVFQHPKLGEVVVLLDRCEHGAAIRVLFAVDSEHRSEVHLHPENPVPEFEALNEIAALWLVDQAAEAFVAVSEVRQELAEGATVH